ncbi:MAG: hypothetical protein U1E05_15155, partial [Patescibacteria group bacterium]|nr:hypothetical protein [Patescibacteria group bacterium]
PEPVSRHLSDVPEELDQVVMQLLEKDPEARVTNAALLVRRLEAMEHALSVSGKTIVRPTLVRTSGVEPPKEPDGLAKTVATGMQLEPDDRGTEAAAMDPGPSAGRSFAVEALAETRVTDAFDGHPRADAPVRSDASGEFVEVTEEELDPLREEEDRPALVSVQTWILTVLLLTIGAGAWYLLQPPSADDLHDRISARAGSKSTDSLLAAQDDIDAFLIRFPGDPRGPTLREYLREIDLHRLQRKFDLRIRGLAETKDLLPIEQAYIEAIQGARTNPERSEVRLKALLALYSQEEPSGPTGLCLQLARRRLEEVRRQVAGEAAQHLAFLGERLHAAEQRRDERPNEARSIYEAIIELYHEKPWAADVVRQAQEGLKQLKVQDDHT